MNSRRSPVRLTLVALASVLVIGGCAERAPEPPADSGGSGKAFPVTVTPPGGEPLTLERKPERIVSLSPSNTETLYAVGAGKQVVAVDELSDYPADAPQTKLSGLNPHVEAISKHQPDLVVISDDTDGLVKALERVKIRVLHVPAAATLDDLYAGMNAIGKATGHTDEAADLARRTKEELAKIAADTPKPAKPLSYYHELGKELYSATSKTFLGEIYGLFGLRNIADKADQDGSGYPQLSAEYILDANPDLVFLADVKCCGQNAKTVAKRPGWRTLRAVRDGNVVPLDDDLASRWGPRVVDLASDVAEAVQAAQR